MSSASLKPVRTVTSKRAVRAASSSIPRCERESATKTFGALICVKVNRLTKNEQPNCIRKLGRDSGDDASA